MAEPSQGQVVSTQGRGSTQSCRLLALPKELRLLIYEAYFGPTQMCFVSWTNQAYWWRDDINNQSRGAPATALLRTSRQIYKEALAVMCDCREVSVHLDYYDVPGAVPKNASHSMADIARILRHVRNIKIEIELDVTDHVCERDIGDLRNVLQATNHGANAKQLVLDLISWTTPRTKEPVLPNDERFKTAISSLQCADGVVNIRRFAVGVAE
ncbi:hypothetical protein LTR56_018010 [Elasticomyces elasticus]|nr:hypothetical protein LTR56_018010 [Elasticomyces elasticus]KAK3663345.1 hypothetical protein LTR22_005752 [Elasticomyces elasticus]KAK4925424.1 hypothetical protein LTR49_007488 [Elasticomyces elasticus]KAK5764519.1 hypothetical protein LTS12_005249 [Elasticomyces elasticus]